MYSHHPDDDDDTHLHSSTQNLVTTNDGGASSSEAAGRGGGHSRNFRGVRRKSGKWVSEIREPKKPTRIWLGTFPTPEMAAVAHDVAALALKGGEAELNFPNSASSYPVPASLSPRDIQMAAGKAAAAVGAAVDALCSARSRNKPTASSDKRHDLFFDEDMIFDMPAVLANMAEGMLLSPPPLDVAADSDDPNTATAAEDHQDLWNSTT